MVMIAFVLAFPVLAGGPLAPPGAPADGVMKTLSEVEPRTPISSIPITITQEGSYYLTQNLSLATPDTHGITVEASHVTIDLCGFTLRGPGKEVGTAGSGIYGSSSNTNLVVRNGTVTEWRYNGICAYNRTGIIENVRATNNGNTGIFVNASYVVHDNVCIGNGQAGINSAIGNSVIDNICSSNDNHGIVTDDANTITGNTCFDNDYNGIQAQGGSTIIGNSCTLNHVDGIYVGDNYAPRSTGCTIRNNSCNENTGNGINGDVGSLVEQNTCTENGLDGIKAWSNCRIVDNLCDRNGRSVAASAGIHVQSGGNTIEGNTVADAGKGVLVDAAGNYIASNRARGNTTNYSIAASNTQGSGDLANVSY